MLPQSKQVIVMDLVSSASGATGTGRVDTLGFDFVSIDTVMATSNATNPPTRLRLMESDDTVVTNFANIVPMTGGTATSATVGFVIPDSRTDTTTLYGIKMNLDLKGRKRWLRIEVSPADTNQITSSVANLHRGDEAPVNATDAGVLVLAEG